MHAHIIRGGGGGIECLLEFGMSDRERSVVPHPSAAHIVIVRWFHFFVGAYSSFWNMLCCMGGSIFCVVAVDAHVTLNSHLELEEVAQKRGPPSAALPKRTQNICAH